MIPFLCVISILLYLKSGLIQDPGSLVIVRGGSWDWSRTWSKML